MNTHKDIVIIGAGLTGLTLAYYLKKAGKTVTVIEKDKYCGGVIKTLHKDGFTFETGPNTGVLGNVETVKLFEDLESDCKLEFANPKSDERWIWKNNKWHNLPAKPIPFLKSSLFSTKDKLNIALEPFKHKGTNPEETLSDMVKRRLGKSFLNYAVNPFVSGVYAGDPDTLVPKYALPKLYNLEQDYGSFIKGAKKKKKEHKTELDKKANRKVFSVEGGIGELIKALVKNIGEENIITDAKISVNNINNIFTSKISTPNKNLELTSDKVISTIGAYALDTVFNFIDAEKFKHISNVRYANMCQVVVAYEKWDGIDLNAFGGLNPSIEKRNSLGILFTGSLFKGRKNDEGALLSIYLGGIRRPDIFNMDDEELIRLVKKEVREMLNSKQEPDLIHISRHKNAIPQYEASSKQRFEAIDHLEECYPGLILAGNIRNGIGMSDRIKQAKDIAEQIIKETKQV